MSGRAQWEIKTSYQEAKSTVLDGRVLRARTTASVTQGGQRRPDRPPGPGTAIADTALVTGDIAPDRLSFTIALITAETRSTKRRASSPRPAPD